jgi:hypothetical protein
MNITRAITTGIYYLDSDMRMEFDTKYDYEKKKYIFVGQPGRYYVRDDGVIDRVYGFNEAVGIVHSLDKNSRAYWKISLGGIIKINEPPPPLHMHF